MGDSTTGEMEEARDSETADRHDSGGEMEIVSEERGEMEIVSESSVEMESVLDPNVSESEREYLEPTDKLNQHDIKIIEGNKNGSKWLVIDGAYVCHANIVSAEGQITYWECKRRRHDR